MKKNTLKNYYQNTLVGELMQRLELTNVHQVPKLEKIVINSGISAGTDKSFLEQVLKDVASISGQKSVATKAKKSISNFKVRQNMPVGVKVVLRGNIMYDFFYKFVSIVLPRVRDFRGLVPRLDGRGNYTVGIKDHTIFPEISVDMNRRNVGMDITFVTTSGNDRNSVELLKGLGMPFRR